MPSEPTEADVQLVHRALFDAPAVDLDGYARAALAALAGAGRLTPDGGRERDEYAVEWLAAGGGIALDRMQITSWAEAHDLGPKYVGQYNITSYRVVRRRWRHFDDGSGTFGPWVEADEDGTG